jgi:hypothetical protein
MSTTIGGVRIADMPDLGAVNDSSSVVGERAGSGRFSAVALKTYVNASLDVANVRNYGAVGNGSTDDTAAIQAAIATGKPVYIPAGNYRITSQINCNTHGQAIRGAGRQATFIRVTGPGAGFSAGIFNVTAPPGTDAGAYFSDFTVALAQPDTNVRASLNVYPPVFFLNAAPRCQFENVRMVGGSDGIYMVMAGGFRATGCDFGCYARNIYIDGSLDVTSFTDCEVWPFSDVGIMTANQRQIFYDAYCFGIFSLRNDYLSWTGGLFLCGRAAWFGTGTRVDAPGPTYGQFSGCGFDTFGGLEVTAGNILTDNCTFSVGGDATQAKNAVRHTGGVVTVRGAKFFVGSTGIANNALIYADVPSGDATLIVENCHFELGANDDRAVYVTPGSGRNLSVIVRGNKLDRYSSGAFTTAMVDLNGGSGVVSDNVAAPFLTATGVLIMIAIGAGAGPFNVSGNAPNGWQVFVTGSTLTAAGVITIPAVFGDGAPILDISGATPISGMTYAVVGVTLPVSGYMITLNFAGAGTITSGTSGTAGQFLLNGRTNFTTAANSSLTVRLSHLGNWVEVGRCA